uniref:RNA binding protein, putative n=1 Tax=Arundo donax TaxID=35708 RepID=A0A0A9E8L3_ARUDO
MCVIGRCLVPKIHKCATPQLSTGTGADGRGPVVGEEAGEHLLRDRLREVPHQERCRGRRSGPRRRLLLLLRRQRMCGGGSRGRWCKRGRQREGRHLSRRG